MNLSYVTGCNIYTYGSECIHCGNCSGGVQCNHVTGTCPNGCDAGIYGDKCDMGNLKIHFSFIKEITTFNVKLCYFSTNCILWMKQPSKLKTLLQEHPYNFLKCQCIVLLYFIHTHKHTMIAFPSSSTCKN